MAVGFLSFRDVDRGVGTVDRGFRAEIRGLRAESTEGRSMESFNKVSKVVC